jgi:hypothetical protein
MKAKIAYPNQKNLDFMFLKSWMFSLEGSSILLNLEVLCECPRKLTLYEEKNISSSKFFQHLGAKNTTYNRFQVYSFQLKQTVTLGIETTSNVEYVQFFPCQRLHRDTAPLGEPRLPDSFDPEKKLLKSEENYILENCYLYVPIYLPLGVDILELEQAGLQVELFSHWVHTCHLA